MSCFTRSAAMRRRTGRASRCGRRPTSRASATASWGWWGTSASRTPPVSPPQTSPNYCSLIDFRSQREWGGNMCVWTFFRHWFSNRPYKWGWEQLNSENEKTIWSYPKQTKAVVAKGIWKTYCIVSTIEDIIVTNVNLKNTNKWIACCFLFFKLSGDYLGMSLPIVTIIHTDENQTLISRDVTIAYYLPADHQAHPPQPTDNDILIEIWPAAVVYTRCVGNNNKTPSQYWSQDGSWQKREHLCPPVVPHVRMGFHALLKHVASWTLNLEH